jgi:hypothetical protein
VDANHMLIAKKFEKKVNSLLKEKEKRQPLKKRTNLSSGSISNFSYEGFLQKGGCATKRIPRGPWIVNC